MRIKWGEWGLSILIIIVIGLGIYSYHKHSLALEKAKDVRLVKDYLVKNGKKMSEIKTFHPVYDHKSGDFNINVIYKNESNKLYQYFYSDHDKRVYLGYVFTKKNGKWEQIRGGLN